MNEKQKKQIEEIKEINGFAHDYLFNVKHRLWYDVKKIELNKEKNKLRDIDKTRILNIKNIQPHDIMMLD